MPDQLTTHNSQLCISLIATVYNEAATIRALLDSLRAQTRPPDEIVIVDGGSTDGTVETLRQHAGSLPLRLIESPGCNIAQGRNSAIRAASGDVIAVADAGVRLPPDWLAHLTAPFESDPGVQVAAGFFHPDPHSLFEVALGATTLPLEAEIDPAKFLPSSRSVAFRKTAWEAVGGYPDWLDYCEDLVFDLRLQACCAPFAWVPQAAAAFRPRPDLRAFWRQYYRYARGDGKADLWRKRHAARYLTYGVAAPLILLLGAAWGPLWWGLYLVGGAIYLRAPYRRLAFNWQAYAPERAPRAWERLTLWLLIPLIRVVGDVAKMVGYPVGWVWRLRNHPPDWRSRPAQ